MNRSASTIRGLVVGALSALAVGAFVAEGGAAQTAGAPQSAQEILDDGLSALEDNETTLARRLFQHLLTAHPGSAEAGRAALELEVMGSEGASGDQVETARGDGASPRGIPSSAGLIAEFRREFLLNVGDRVFFAENSAEIGGRARAVIDHQARWLKVHTNFLVTIIGRADDKGSPQDATDLSMQRAEAVRARLTTGGVAENRIVVDARGDRDPLALCRTSLCQAQNRHAETLIGDPQQARDSGRLTR